MSKVPPHDSLATRLAALQQGMAKPLVTTEGGIAPYATSSLTPSARGSRRKALREDESSLSASHLMGASPPSPLPAGSLALRTDKKQTSERASRLMGASPPSPVDSQAPPFRFAPSPAGSLALRTDKKQTPERAARLMGASPPSPLPAGSLALRTDKKQTSERAALLIGASKSQPVELLEEAITLGLCDFGENKVQEAQSKWPALKARHPHVRLHLIGPLQSNKAADAVALFDVIHSIDRPKIADALATACQKLGYLSASRTDGGLTPKPPPQAARPSGYAEQNQTIIAKKAPQFLIQVNTGEEPQKAGVSPREAAALLAHCCELGLDMVGLMCVPPEGVNPAPHFALLKKMADEMGLAELSMGMSSDYETAIRLGATMVRVGTALFGAR